jgi:phosphatidylinositol alpha 1,6-mannosyltransferase
MKVMIITPYALPEYNGISISTLQRTRSLRKMGHTVALVLPDYGGRFLQSRLDDASMACWGFPTSTLKGSGFTYLPRPLATGRMIESAVTAFEPEVVFMDDPFTFLLAGVYYPRLRRWKAAGIKTLAISHGDTAGGLEKLGHSAMAGFIRRIYPRVYQPFDRCIFPSESLFEKYPKVKNGRVCHFLGVDSERFQYIERQNHKPVLNVVHVSRLAFDKNIDLVYETASRLTSWQGMQVIWTFVGDGPAYAAWKQKETENIRFPGAVPYEEIHRYYQAADVYISACDYESFGLTIAEAMSTGLPVVVPDQGNAARHFEQGVSGFSYPAGDADALTGILQSLLGDAEKRAAVGKAAALIPISWDQGTRNLLACL